MDKSLLETEQSVGNAHAKKKKKKKSHCRIKSQSQGHSGCYGFHSCHVPASMGMSCDPRDGSLPVSQPHTVSREDRSVGNGLYQPISLGICA